jgi:hypothetical protein
MKEMMTLRRRVMSSDGILSYPDAQENNQLRCMILLHDDSALHSTSRTQELIQSWYWEVETAIRQRLRRDILKPGPVWVKAPISSWIVLKKNISADQMRCV